tara:strand:+ start:890 stop:1702 length:813 start_codon:yes stop_codon:yes gene_type:complete
MANTFTSNYAMVKSEIGGDNQNWGQNAHLNWDEIDSELVNKVDNLNLKSWTSSGITFTNTGSSTGTMAVASGDLFQDFKIGDKINVSGATNGANNATHTITAKTQNTITVSTGLTTEESGASVRVALIIEPYHLSSNITDVVTLTVSGVSTLNGAVAIGSDSADDITINGSLNSNLIPKTTNNIDLGSSSKKFKDLHISGTSNINALVADGTFALSGSGTIAGCSSLTTTASTIAMSGYTIGTNAKGNRHLSNSAPTSSDGADGDVWYEY